MAKVKKAKPRRPNQIELLGRIETFLSMIAPDVVKRLTEAEMRANQAESDLAFVRDRLVALLSEDQLEAAKISGMTPEIYALACIDLWKDGRISKSVFELKLEPLSVVRYSTG